MRRYDSGERVVFLLDEQRLPLCWPTLYASVRLRQAGLAVNSIKNQLKDLTVLLRWEQFHGRDIAKEFGEGRLLSVADLVSIKKFAAKRFDGANEGPPSSSNTAIRSLEADLAPLTSPTEVSKVNQYNRLTTIANYIEQRMRADLNGHRSLESGKAYNRRHVREATDRIVLETQQRQWDRATQSTADDDA